MKKILALFTIIVLLCLLQFGNALPLYCQATFPVPTSNTSGMTLLHVSIVTRHGDRTPTQLIPDNEVDWECGFDSMIAYPSLNGAKVPIPDRLFRKTFIGGKESLKGNCMLGQLTQTGYQQHQLLGNIFRDMYVNESHLISPFYNSSEFYLRSTNYERTLQSAQGEMSVIFPQSNEPLSIIQIRTIDESQDDMEGSNAEKCPELGRIVAEIQKSSAWKATAEEAEKMQKQIAQMLGLSVSQVPALTAFIDNFRARQCHGKTLPKGFTDSFMDQLQAIVDAQMRLIYENPQYTYFTIGQFVGDIWDNLNSDLSGKTSFKYRYYSGHDSTVGPLSGSLGVFKSFAGGTWPPYASHLEIEIWQQMAGQKQRFVKTKYNGFQTDMVLFEDFERMITSRIPKDFKKECGVKFVPETRFPFF